MKHRFFLSSLVVIASVFNFFPLYAINNDADGGAGAPSAKKFRREGLSSLSLPSTSSSFAVPASPSGENSHFLRSKSPRVSSISSPSSPQIAEAQGDRASASGGATASLGSLTSTDRSMELYSDSDKAIQKILSTLENRAEVSLIQMWTDWRHDPKCSKVAFASACTSVLPFLRIEVKKIKQTIWAEISVVSNFFSAISSNDDFKYFSKSKGVVGNDYTPNNITNSADNLWFLCKLSKEIDQKRYNSLKDDLISDFLSQKDPLPFVLHYTEEDLFKHIKSIEEEETTANSRDDNSIRWDGRDNAKKLLPFAQALVLKNKREEILKKADSCFDGAEKTEKIADKARKIADKAPEMDEKAQKIAIAARTRSASAFKNFMYAETFYDAAFMKPNSDRAGDIAQLKRAVSIQNYLIKNDTKVNELVRVSKIIDFQNRIIKLQDKMLQK